MKSKYMLSALAFLLVMTMSTTAFAQGVFRLSSGTESRGRMNGHAEATGDISLFLINGNIDETGEGTSGTVKIDYGVPITNDFSAVTSATTDDPLETITVTVCNTTRLKVEDPAETTGNRVSLSSDKETLTITIDDCDDDAPSTEVINVEGVLLSLVGSGAESITASISTSGDVRLLNEGTAVVISSVVSPLNDDTVEVDKKLELIRHTGEPGSDDKAPKGKFVLVVAEPHNDSFNGANLRLVFSGIPDDVEIDLDAWLTKKSNYEKDPAEQSPMVTAYQNEITGISPSTVKSDRVVTLDLVGRSRAADADADPEITALTATMLSSSADVVIIRGSISGTDEEELLPLDLEIQVTVDLGPIGEIDDASPQQVPRFDSNETTPMTVIESTSSQTKLTAPYVLYSAPYDTGIAVSNTSTNLTGAIHFAFYMGGVETKYSTSSMLAPKSTMSVLLSELLMNAGHTGDFVGYMTITTDFSGGIGSVFISDFAGFTAAVALK